MGGLIFMYLFELILLAQLSVQDAAWFTEQRSIIGLYVEQRRIFPRENTNEGAPSENHVFKPNLNLRRSAPNQHTPEGIIFPETNPHTGLGKEDEISVQAGESRQHGISFPSHNKTERNQTEKCLASHGAIFYNGQCEDIFSEKPCPTGHWLVLKNGGEPTCEKRSCPKEKFLYQGVCVSIHDQDVCGQHEILYVEFNGISFCDCHPDYIYDPKRDQCFLEYERGPCNHGEYMEVQNDKISCAINPCVQNDLIQNPDTKKCHNKRFKGSCKSKKGFQLTFEGNEALCVTINNRNIFEVPTVSSCPRGSKRDYTNTCNKTFKFNRVIPSNVYVSLNESCRPGYVVFPDGSCGKINPIFKL